MYEVKCLQNDIEVTVPDFGIEITPEPAIFFHSRTVNIRRTEALASPEQMTEEGKSNIVISSVYPNLSVSVAARMHEIRCIQNEVEVYVPDFNIEITSVADMLQNGHEVSARRKKALASFQRKIDRKPMNASKWIFQSTRREGSNEDK